MSQQELLKNYQLRAQAREKLSGRWLDAAGYSFLFIFLVMGASFILMLIPFLGYVAYMLLIVPFGVALRVFPLRLKRKLAVSPQLFFNDALENFNLIWTVTLKTIWRLLLPFVLVMVSTFVLVFSLALLHDEAALALATLISLALITASSIYLTVRALSYVLTPFLIFDRPQSTANEILDLSERLMKDRKWKFVGLMISFFGWYILSSLTLGLGFFFFYPYISVTQACFYDECLRHGKIKKK